MSEKFRRGFTMLELIVSVCALVFLLAITIVMADEAQDAKNRQRCASNLEQIWQGIMLYSNENKGQFPRTKADPATDKVVAYTGSDAKDPFANDGPKPNDVTAGMFLLVLTQDIPLKTFICPSTDNAALLLGGKVEGFSNFGAKKHLSYSFTNPYPSAAATKAGYTLRQSRVDKKFVIAGDMNPGGEALLKINTNSSAEDLRAANSANHGQDGQNLLCGDGHVEFVKTPLSGLKHDNVYTYGASGEGVDKGGDGIIGSPVGPNDSILLPTAEQDAEAEKENNK